MSKNEHAEKRVDVCIYDFVFGVRKRRAATKKFNGDMIIDRDSPLPDWKVEPVPIRKLKVAIDSVGILLTDAFGLTRVATNEEEKVISTALSDYALADVSEESGEQYRIYLTQSDQRPEWFYFGWMENDLPDFDGLYSKLLGNKLELKSPNKGDVVYGVLAAMLKDKLERDDYNAFLDNNSIVNGSVKDIFEKMLKTIGVSTSDKPLKRTLDKARDYGRKCR
jgi:hypothetical protein